MLGGCRKELHRQSDSCTVATGQPQLTEGSLWHLHSRDMIWCEWQARRQQHPIQGEGCLM